MPRWRKGGTAPHFLFVPHVRCRSLVLPSNALIGGGHDNLSFPRKRLGCHSRGIGNPISAHHRLDARRSLPSNALIGGGHDNLSFPRKRLGCHSRGGACPRVLKSGGNPIYALNMWSRRMGSRFHGNDTDGCHSRGIGNPIYALNMWSRRMGSRLLGNDRLFWSPPPINPFEGRLHGNDIACWAMLAGLPSPARLTKG